MDRSLDVLPILPTVVGLSLSRRLSVALGARVATTLCVVAVCAFGNHDSEMTDAGVLGVGHAHYAAADPGRAG